MNFFVWILGFFVSARSTDMVTLIGQEEYSYQSNVSFITFNLERPSADFPIVLLAKVNEFPSLSFNDSSKIWYSEYDYFNIDLWLTSKLETQLSVKSETASKKSIFFSVFLLNTILIPDITYSILEQNKEFCPDYCFGSKCGDKKCNCKSDHESESCEIIGKEMELNQIYEKILNPKEIQFTYLQIKDPINMKYEFVGNDTSNILVFTDKSNDLDDLSSMVEFNDFISLPMHLDEEYKVKLGIEYIVWVTWCLDNTTCKFQIHAYQYKDMENLLNMILIVVLTIVGGLIVVIIIAVVRRWRLSRESENVVQYSDIMKYKSAYKPTEWKELNESELLCSICYENFEYTSLVRKLLCMHIFHVECIDKWINVKLSCPLCNKNLL